jgi:hypothetical protein
MYSIWGLNSSEVEIPPLCHGSIPLLDYRERTRANPMVRDVSDGTLTGRGDALERERERERVLLGTMVHNGGSRAGIDTVGDVCVCVREREVY